MAGNEDNRIKRKGQRPMPQLMAVAAFAALSLALVVAHVLAFAPNLARVEHPQPFTGDRSPLREALAPEAVAARFRAISDLDDWLFRDITYDI